jgi:hypothetical protein
MPHLAFITSEDLSTWLAASHIDIARLGQGDTKRLDDLWQEYISGEASFTDDPPMRLLEVAEIIIRRGDHILIELEQEFRDGRRRVRQVPPVEKMKPGEDPRAAALRCLREELGLVEENVEMADEWVTTERVEDSASYPGLRTRYRFHTFEAATGALPDEDFIRENAGHGDPVRRHRWGWRPEHK